MITIINEINNREKSYRTYADYYVPLFEKAHQEVSENFSEGALTSYKAHQELQFIHTLMVATNNVLKETGFEAKRNIYGDEYDRRIRFLNASIIKEVLIIQKYLEATHRVSSRLIIRFLKKYNERMDQCLLQVVD